MACAVHSIPETLNLASASYPESRATSNLDRKGGRVSVRNEDGEDCYVANWGNKQADEASRNGRFQMSYSLNS